MIVNPAAQFIPPADDVDHEEQVIAVDEWTDTDSDVEPRSVQLPIPQVDIAPLPEFQNIEPVIPLPEDEVQLQYLLGFAGNMHPDNGENNIQIGMVHIARPLQDPVFGILSPLNSAFKPCPDAFILWVKFFSQQPSTSQPIFIPDKWMNFFLSFYFSPQHLTGPRTFYNLMLGASLDHQVTLMVLSFLSLNPIQMFSLLPVVTLSNPLLWF